MIEELVRMISEREQLGVSTELKWLKGHAQDKGNIAADALAVNGARVGRDERRKEEARVRAEANATIPMREEEEDEDQASNWL